MADLADATMDKMCAVTSHKGWVPTVDEIGALYKLGHADSKLHLFLARFFCYVTLNIGEDNRKGNFWPNHKLRDLAKVNDDLTLQFFSLLRLQSGQVFPDPRKSPPCNYHQHGKDIPCPYIKK